MNTQKILQFCLERGLLLDKEVLSLFQETEDIESVKLIIEKIKDSTSQRIITKNLFNQNKDKVFQILSTLPKENQQQLQELKIKLGWTIEISHAVLQDKKEKQTKQTGAGVQVLSVPIKSNKKIEASDFTRYLRNRVLEMKEILQENASLKNLVSINKLSTTRQAVSIIGIVSDKTITKNKNMILEIEDLTGKLKVLINFNNPKLYEKAEDICLDSILGFSGFGNNEILFASEIVFPEASLAERKRSPYEEYAVFTGDLHFGSKLFLKEGFDRFVDYINGKVPNTPEAEKIKYLFLVGDLIAGVGNYPSQEKDLAIKDIEEQFIGVSQLLSKIRSDVKIIISPGNHDAVRLMEPQPLLNERFAWSLYNMKNVILTGNPAYVTIGQKENFSGLNVLTYHGFSFPYYANIIPSLIKTGKAMNTPDKIMAYLLKNRHLAPSHTSVQHHPSEEDALIIKKLPDVFLSGHTHKSAVSYYNNILMISSSSWEAMTARQEKMGNEPDFCKVPMLNMKTGTIKVLDFEDEKKEEIKMGEIGEGK